MDTKNFVEVNIQLFAVAEVKLKPLVADIQLFAIAVPTNLVQKVWAQELMRVAMNNIFFSKFTGTGAENIIQVKTELNKERGDKIWIPLLLKLKGNPITGDNKLEGSEQDLKYTDFGVTIDQYRWAVRSTGEMEEQKSQLNMRRDAKTGLQVQIEEWLDKTIFDKLTTSPTANRVIYAGGKSSEGEITTTDVFNTDIIGIAKRKAQMSNPIIRPVNVDGGSYYVMVVDPYQARDLKNDEKWFNAQKDANIRGKSNPIFSGALGVWDKVIVHEAETCPRTKTGSASAMVGHALLLGAQAAVIAQAVKANWREDTFDYGNQWGVAVRQILGIAKTQYTIDDNLTDFATINILTSSADDVAAA